MMLFVQYSPAGEEPGGTEPLTCLLRKTIITISEEKDAGAPADNSHRAQTEQSIYADKKNTRRQLEDESIL